MYLLTAKAQVNLFDVNHYTPLHWAAIKVFYSDIHRYTRDKNTHEFGKIHVFFVLTIIHKQKHFCCY